MVRNFTTMNTLPKLKICYGWKQRGVVLFFTLIALVVMSLAAVALIRSVDTSTMIAGNLAFRQSGGSSTDTGIEAAIAWLSATQATMQAANKDVYQDAAHVFNNDHGNTGVALVNLVVYSTATPPPIGFSCCANNGYLSSFDPAVSLTNPNPASGTGIKWDNNDSFLVVTDTSNNTIDSSGNTIRFVIQRMCRTANTLPASTPASESPAVGTIPAKTGCLYSNNAITNNQMNVLNATQVCQGAGCAKGGQTVLMRITVKVTGPKNTVSYAQTIVF
jgi:type IV pilus assembly protein PilX